MTSPRTLAAVLATCAVVGCSPEPQVEVSTYVGPTHARHDQERAARHAREVLAAKLSTLLDNPEQAPAETTVEVPAAHPPRDADELAGLIEAIRDSPLGEIGGPARRIAAAGPEVWPQVEQMLLAERPAPRGDYRSLLKAIGGDMPNRYGHFALHWKRDHGYPVKLSEDWLEDLLALAAGRVSSRLRPVYRDTIRVTALMRAAANAAADPRYRFAVVDALLDLAWADDGMFRDEVSRAIESIGDPAIAPLLAASEVPPHDKRTELEVWVGRPRYALAMLDRMDRLVPERALEAVSTDPELLSSLLAAYGVTRRADAAPEILAHVDADDAAVRTAARIAWLNYVAGPLPPARSRTIKLLGGGTGRAQAFLSYRARAELALRDEIARHAPHLLATEPECELRRDDGELDVHCERQPLRLTDAWFAHLDEARRTRLHQALDEALSTADADLAIQRIDELLAQAQTLTKTQAVVDFIADVGRERVADDPARGAQLLRKAAVLCDAHDEDRARALRVEALLAESSVDGLEPNGRQMLLRTADALEPDDARVDRALRRRGHRVHDDPGRPPVRRLAGGVGLLALMLGCLSFVGRGLRRRL